jgi:ankyrin repeat protein
MVPLIFICFVHSVNSDGLTPLDVAFLSNNRELVRLLLIHGATEGKVNRKYSISIQIETIKNCIICIAVLQRLV